MKKLLCLALVLLASNAEAELKKCNGTWTNLACDAPVQDTMAESKRSAAPKIIDIDAGSSSSSAVLEPLAPRLELIRKLKKVSDEYRTKGGHFLSREELDAFRRGCEDRTRPFSECLGEFNNQQNKLVSQNQKKEELNQNSNRNEIEADRNRAIRGR